MKMKRMIASVLALLLMVSLLPIGVMADTVGNNPKGETVTEIASGKEMEVNEGTIKTNNGTVITNDRTGTVETNAENGKITTNKGTVGSENKFTEARNEAIEEATGEPVNPSEPVEITKEIADAIANILEDQKSGNFGTITDNGASIFYNGGFIETNGAGVDLNNGTVETNNGTVNLNTGTVETNDRDVFQNFGTVETNNWSVLLNTGTVETNNNTVFQNTGTVETNNGGVFQNTGTVETNDRDVFQNFGTVENNNQYVEQNDGTVETNANSGKIETNNGKITTNKGMVGSENKLTEARNEAIEEATGEPVNPSEPVEITKEIADAIANILEDQKSGNFGTITDNGAFIFYNGGFIETNGAGVDLNNGTVETNNGTVNLNTGTVETNIGVVSQNFGTVETNDGRVFPNFGTVETNNQYVHQNTGTVETNNGGVFQNIGTVVTNNQYVDQNTGTVVTNAIDGFVQNGGLGEIVGEYSNADTSEKKPSADPGTVEYNFGTVKDYTELDNEGKPTIYYGLSWGENTDHLNLIDGEVVEGTEKNLDEIAKGVNNSGYRMTGYTAYYRADGKDIKIEETNRYTMNAPTWLKILWEKIVNTVGSNEPEAKKTSIPTTLSADQVKVGAYVRRGNLLFRIIEVGDDYIRVATVPKLSEQALADMLGFLKQHLSDAQIAKINGEPALLEQELVTYFFGGTFEHISFYAAPDLFA